MENSRSLKRIFNWFKREDKIDLGLSVEWATESIATMTNGGLIGRLSRWGDYITSYEEPSPHSAKTFDMLVEEGVITAEGNLTPEYDLATRICGKGWRIPTEEEMSELITECEWELISKNGLTGMKVTGPNGRHIMLHAGGYWNPGSPCDSNGVSDGSYNRTGLFWTSSAIKESESVCALWFTIEGDVNLASVSRSLFAQVLPVCDKQV